MKITGRIFLVLLVLLSCAAGIAKIMQLPAEMKFLQGAGLSANMVLVFGLAQLLGGIGLIFKKTRIVGALVVALMLFISTIIIFMSGNIAFGLISALPILMAALIIVMEVNDLNNQSMQIL